MVAAPPHNLEKETFAMMQPYQIAPPLSGGDFTGEIHPAAALFPMLPDDELRELAEDIKANGLIHPVVLDTDGALIDGRNRLAACRMAGVEPTYTVHDGAAVAYVLSANVNRRHISKGQRAMAVASLLETNKSTQTDGAAFASVSQSRIAQANTVRRYADELGPAVMAGTLSLDNAYAEARERKVARETREEREERAERDLALLRVGAPDLAELVAEERISLAGALAEWRDREQKEHERRQRTTRRFVDSLAMLYAVTLDRPEEVADDWLPVENMSRSIEGVKHLWTVDGVRDMARSLDRVADGFEARGGFE